jgi:hypothetical protein
MENMRAVFVNQNSRVVVMVVSVAADVQSFVHEQNFFTMLAGKAFG